MIIDRAAVTLATMPRRDGRTYSTREVADLTGATYRMLDYWCRCGLLPDQPAGTSTGSGYRRRLTEHDVHRVRTLLVVSRIRNRSMLEVVYELEGIGVLELIERQLVTLAPPRPATRAELPPPKQEVSA